MAFTEQEYNELYKHALKTAFKFIGNHDDACDLAQNALLALISSKAEITNPKSWIQTTVRRETSKFIKEKNKSDELAKENLIAIKKPKAEEESDDIFNVDNYKAFQLLSKADYEEFKLFKKYDFKIAKYAEKRKISYDSAHERKKKLKRNLTSALLIEDGWKDSLQILNYSQYVNINRFIRQLDTSIKSNTLGELKNYLKKVDKADFEALFQGVTGFLEWTIQYKKSIYELILVYDTQDHTPRILRLYVDFSANNYINVIDAKALEITLVLPPGIEKIQRYKNKGKIDLGWDQTLAIITDKQTTI
jgi:DNA-directed RNA polymerase specialized sigma24 family protein